MIPQRLRQNDAGAGGRGRLFLTVAVIKKCKRSG